MATKNYTINFTDSTKNEITILPNTSAGPSGGVRYTDIDLIGMGNSLWGEKILENLLHILENFSSDDDGTGNPATGFLGDLTPVEGQLWYNQTTGNIHVYSTFGSPASWVIVGGVSSGVTVGPIPPDISNGALWWDSNLTERQLKINVSGSWIRIVDDYLLKTGGDITGPVTTTSTLLLAADPTLNLQAATKQYTDTKVSKAGDSMTGILDMGGNEITNILDPTAAQDAVTLGYADGNYLKLSGGTLTGPLDMGGNKITSILNPSSSQDAVTLIYANNNYVNVTGDTMTGGLIVNSTIQGSILTSTNNIVCNTDLSVGSVGNGNSVISFYDDTNSTPRDLMWNDTTNEFMVEDTSGSLNTLIHSGNITNFSQPMTLIPSFNILNASQGSGTVIYTLNYNLAGVPASANYVLLQANIAITNVGGTGYRIINGSISGTLILSGNSRDGAGGTFSSQWWVPKANNLYSVSQTAPGVAINVYVEGWM